MRDTGIERRKRSHLELCERADVEHATKTTLFEEVELVHDALPELSLDEIDLSTTFVGKPLRAPFLITGMTGGTAEAAAVNRDLAKLAERHGIAFGLGSQRAMHGSPKLAATYRVRKSAPTTVVLANLGLNQAAKMTAAEVEALVAAVGADALCLHLNPAQELVQREGDRSFRGGLDTLRRLRRELRRSLIVKETGCGISAAVAARLVSAGVGIVDVSGAGGTSWVRVEQLRGDERSQKLGELYRDWGIPTAASLVQLRGSSLIRIASGGIRNALDAARAIALGATLCGFALPVFRAYRRGGLAAASNFIDEMIEGLRVALLLTGSRDLETLRSRPVVIGPTLQRWAAVGVAQKG
jgi:isopentenyl-diphosphate Delta-isomerase